MDKPERPGYGRGGNGRAAGGINRTYWTTKPTSQGRYRATSPSVSRATRRPWCRLSSRADGSSPPSSCPDDIAAEGRLVVAVYANPAPATLDAWP